MPKYLDEQNSAIGVGVIRFAKYDAVGNDYLVVEASARSSSDWVTAAQLLCTPHHGIGSDGLLVLEPNEAPQSLVEQAFRVAIYNPDGSRAGMSGNGVRILSRYLFDAGRVAVGHAFKVDTGSRIVEATVLAGGRNVRVGMGPAGFHPTDIPLANLSHPWLNHSLNIGNETFSATALSMGNPHCVLFASTPFAQATVHQIGPQIETHPNFPERTNVQFATVEDRRTVRLEIWERGAGYTLASGSSACAAVAAAYKLGYVDQDVAVMMPGGSLTVHIDDNFEVTLTGGVRAVCTGDVANDLLELLNVTNV